MPQIQGANYITPKMPQQYIKSPNDKLSIFYINDLHGNTDYLGGLFSASKYFDLYALKNNADSLKLSGGDNYSGSDEAKNSLVISLLSQLGIQYSAVGNHEFDAFSDGFAKSAKDKSVKFVSSNLDIDNDNELDKIITKSQIHQTKDGKTYGIIGATTPEIKKVTATGALKGVEVEDLKGTIEELQEEIDDLKKQKVNKIILVSHIGYENDKYLAKNLSGLDVIVSGHSHTLIKDVKKGENLVAGLDGNPVIIVQAGENGKNYGILDVEFDQSGVIVRTKNSVEETIPANSALITKIEDEVLGGSEIIANIKNIDEMPKNKRAEPCAWTNLLADAMKSEFSADIAFINSANVRRVPNSGELTMREIKESTPFDNTIVTSLMNEEEIVNAIKFANKSMTNVDNMPGLLQVSGLRYKINRAGELLELNFIDKYGKSRLININAPNKARTYNVVYDSFLADGREYPPLSVKGKEAKNHDITKEKVACNYICKMPQKTRDNLIVTDDGRLMIV